jgi:hypothetical protein
MKSRLAVCPVAVTLIIQLMDIRWVAVINHLGRCRRHLAYAILTTWVLLLGSARFLKVRWGLMSPINIVKNFAYLFIIFKYIAVRDYLCIFIIQAFL